MDFFKHHDHTTVTGTILPSGTIIVPTSTISVNPPGGTGHPTHGPLPSATHSHGSHHHHGHFPDITFVHAHHPGHAALWVIFGLMTFGLIGVFVLALRVEKRARIFHWLSGLVLTIAMVSYFAMAAGLGHTHVPASGHDHHHIVLREVYYARYIDWVLTTPLLVISLAVLAGLSPYDTVLAIFADIFMVITGLLSSVVPSWHGGEKAQWGFYAVSCVGFIYLWYILITGGLKAARYRPSKTRGLYVLLGGGTFIIWSIYPIIFALSEGTNRFSVDAEIIAYGVLDVIAKIGFTFLLLLVHTHGEDDTWILPEWFVQHRVGRGADGRGGYGSINDNDD